MPKAFDCPKRAVVVANAPSGIASPMTGNESKSRPFRPYRTPRAPNSHLCDPPLHQWSDIADRNQAHLEGFDTTVAGMPLRELRQLAQRELLQSVLAYQATRPGASPSKPSDVVDASKPISHSSIRTHGEKRHARLIVGGHQPEMFHAGVWFKNAMLAKMAKETDSVTIHLQIDHDLCRSLAIKVPGRDEQGKLRLQSIEVEPLAFSQPWETLPANDLASWRSFEERVALVSEGLLKEEPLLRRAWKDAVAIAEQGVGVGEALSWARYRVERTHGWTNQEVPFSRVAERQAFGYFVCDIVSDLPRFHQGYHASRDIYRQHYRIRNEAHPVPKLGRDADWWDAPFWVYSQAKPERLGVWCRQEGEQLQISNRRGWACTLSRASLQNDPQQAWEQLRASGMRIRPRALTMTLFARVILSDLFLHGIGGGMYDQMTDLLIHDWYGMIAPEYAVATATVHLPMAVTREASRTPHQIREQIWCNRYRAEKLESPVADEDRQIWHALAARKRELLHAIPPRGSKEHWQRQMESVNHGFQALMVEAEQDLWKQLPLAEQAMRQVAILESREYAWPLFPSSLLTDPQSPLAI